MPELRCHRKCSRAVFRPSGKAFEGRVKIWNSCLPGPRSAESVDPPLPPHFLCSCDPFPPSYPRLSSSSIFLLAHFGLLILHQNLGQYPSSLLFTSVASTTGFFAYSPLVNFNLRLCSKKAHNFGMALLRSDEERAPPVSCARARFSPAPDEETNAVDMSVLRSDEQCCGAIAICGIQISTPRYEALQNLNAHRASQISGSD